MDVTSDFIVIGVGPRGYVTAIRGATGVEDCHRRTRPFGGICLNWGCIRTKALLKRAEPGNSLSHLEEFGALASELREWKLGLKERRPFTRLQIEAVLPRGDLTACDGRQDYSMVCEKNTKNNPSIP
jgi:pyruvate/2-oxoglutarate dehydrogenase complex dihydrolipoamide dehydrogenase (E3) component